MTNKEKFLALVAREDTSTAERHQERIANRQWLNASQDIALMVLDKLKELEWSQKDLAERMEVSPQYVNKIVKGRENLTLETIIKLQNSLGIAILEGYQPKVNITYPSYEFSIWKSPLVKSNFEEEFHIFQNKYSDTITSDTITCDLELELTA